MYAVIKTGGKQHRVTEGDVIAVEKINGSKGDTVFFNEVLMVVKGEDVRVGTPVLDGARVACEIIEQTKSPKIHVFRMKRRKGYRKKTGHRQNITKMRIKEISL
jgi:large subunit ribosomal protein L21